MYNIFKDGDEHIYTCIYILVLTLYETIVYPNIKMQILNYLNYKNILYRYIFVK